MSELEQNNQQQQTQSNQLVNGPEAASEVTNYSKKVITQVMERRGFLDRLFPDQLQQTKIKGELDLMKTEYAAAKRFVEILRQSQEQSLIETCNEKLSNDKSQSRKNIASYIAQKREELQQETEEYIESFLNRMDEKLTQIEQYQNPKVREARQKQLERDLEDFMALQEESMEQFSKNVFKGVSLD